MQGLNGFCKEIHKANVEKGFYDDQPSLDRQLILVIGELSEAHEAIRKDNFCKFDIKNINEEFEKMSINWFEKEVKNTFEDEIADAIIRLFDICGDRYIDIESHISAKLKYNKQRPYKHGKKF